MYEETQINLFCINMSHRSAFCRYFKATGMMELQFAALIPNTLRTTMAALSLLSWHLFVTYVIGIGQPDLALCRKLLQPLTERYPNVMGVNQRISRAFLV